MAATDVQRDDPTVLPIPTPLPPRNLASRGLLPGIEALSAADAAGRPAVCALTSGRSGTAPRLAEAAEPSPRPRVLRLPGHGLIPDLPPEPPDLLHGHNLHGRTSTSASWRR